MKKTKKKIGKKKATKAALLLADDIALDGGNDQRSRAVKQVASRMAARLGAALDIVHVEDSSFYPVRDPSFARMFERYAREQKAGLESRVVADEVPTRSILLSGSPAGSILALAKKKDAYQMVVLGTQGRRGISRLMTGSVAEEVIRNANIPVMTVGPGVQENATGALAAEKPRILVPVSLTKNSDRAEELALRLAKSLGGEVVLFHSLYDGLHPVVRSVYGMPTLPPEAAAMVNDMKNNALRALTKKVDAARKKGVTAYCVLHHACQDADTAVLEQAKAGHASLIVMGTHGRSLFAGSFLGRTARGVILGAEVPVITVRSRSA